MSDKEERAIALHSYGVLDSPNEPEFDKIVREAAAIANTPIALISLLDEDRQWFKAQVGLQISETPLSISFCTHAVQRNGVFEVRDASVDDRFERNPLVTGNPHIRYYAGAPLRTSTGTRIGTLCVIDNVPRSTLSADDKTKLLGLADEVVAAFEKRQMQRTS